MEKDLWELDKKFGVIEKEIFTKLSYKKNYDMLFPSFFQFKTKESREKLRLKVKETTLEENERDFYNALLDYFSISFKDGEWLGVSALVGSTHYVSQTKKQGRKIKGLINIDTVGYTSTKKNSQTYPKGIPVNLLQLATKPIIKSIPILSKSVKTTGVKDVTVGDFASLLVDSNSSSEADLFIKNAKQVKLKVVGLYTGMDYANISINLPDLLRADHAPFWRDNIHAIFISDTANFRCPHYHKGSDTIEHVDFDFVKKVAQTSLLTMIDMAEE